MRIAVISDLWISFPGGAERLMFNITRELHRRQHDVFVYCSYENCKEANGIKPFFKSTGVHKYDHCPGHTHDDGWNDIKTWLQDVARPDIILTHGYFSNEFESEIFSYGVPVVLVMHNGRRNSLAALAIYNSEYTKRRGNPHSQDMVILPPAFEDCIAPSHGHYIGFVKPIPHKGVEFVFELAGHCSNREFMILHGEWTHIEIIRDLPNITYMTAVNDIREFYGKCRILLMPSLAEDAGTIPQEAALNGVPCISSDVMGLPETNRGGIVLPHDKLVWAAEIDKLDNPAYYAEVASRQKNYIESLNWKVQFDELSEKVTALGRK